MPYKVRQEDPDGGDIHAELDKQATLSEEVAKEAAEKIAKANKERKIEEMTELLQRDHYVTSKIRLQLRRQRGIAKAHKAFMTAAGKLSDDLKAAKHDKASYDKAYKEAYKKREEAIREEDKIYSEYCDKLKGQFSRFQSFWSWDNFC